MLHKVTSHFENLKEYQFVSTSCVNLHTDVCTSFYTLLMFCVLPVAHFLLEAERRSCVKTTEPAPLQAAGDALSWV